MRIGLATTTTTTRHTRLLSLLVVIATALFFTRGRSSFDRGGNSDPPLLTASEEALEAKRARLRIASLRDSSRNACEFAQQYCLPPTFQSRPQAYLLHIQKTAGSWLCKTLVDNLGKGFGDGKEDEEQYRCEIIDPLTGKRMRRYNHLSNRELVVLMRASGNRKVLATQWEPFPSRSRFELREKGFMFLTSLRHPLARMCSLMFYKHPTGYDMRGDFEGFTSRRGDNPMIRALVGANATSEAVPMTEADLEEAKARLASSFDYFFVSDHRFEESVRRFFVNALGWTRVNASLAVNARGRRECVELTEAGEEEEEVVGVLERMLDDPEKSRRLARRFHLDMELWKWAKRVVDARLDCCGRGEK